jgi:signal transduction histidine kinase
VTSRTKGWSILIGGALAAAAALGWVTLEALSLEREGARAKAEARFEERVRLALWRMDSYLAPVIAAEAVRPHFHYASFYAEEDAFTRAWNDIPSGEVLVASPLLNKSDNSNGYLHFEIPPEGGVRSPQAPQGVMGDNAVPTYLTTEALNAANGRLIELQSMFSNDEISRLRARASHAPMTELVTPAEAPSAIPRNAKPRTSSSQVKTDEEASGRNAKLQTQAPGLKENDKQRLISANEFSNRFDANFNASGQGGMYQSQVRRNVAPRRQRSLSKENPTRGKGAPPKNSTPVPLKSRDLPGHATSSGSSERLKLGSLVPTWVGKEKNELVLVRMVERGGRGGQDGRRYVQGIWLKWPEIRRRLLAQVRDLLPGASLLPTPEGTPDTTRALASIPAALVPGEVALVPARGAFTPARVALMAAWGALAAAVLTSGLSLRAANDLSDRRARFVSAVTHELRTPLTTFQLYTDMLVSGMAPEESRGEYLATLKGESERLSLLVENVLAYAKLEDGRVTRTPERVDAAELVEGSLGRARERAEACGMSLAVEVAPEATAATALADSGAVEQILFNLIDNACKHAAPDAEDADGDDAERQTISVRVTIEGRTLVVRVADHGGGVPAAERKRIFEPFHRVEGATAAGVGLGLALSRNLARSGGGDLKCEAPPPEGGAVFALKIPLA